MSGTSTGYGGLHSMVSGSAPGPGRPVQPPAGTTGSPGTTGSAGTTRAAGTTGSAGTTAPALHAGGEPDSCRADLRLRPDSQPVGELVAGGDPRSVADHHSVQDRAAADPRAAAHRAR